MVNYRGASEPEESQEATLATSAPCGGFKILDSPRSVLQLSAVTIAFDGTQVLSMKIAVVAVHGVGKHLAGETQNAMADLLLSLPARGPYDSARNYSEFVSVDLQIPLQPVKTIASLSKGAALPRTSSSQAAANRPDGMNRLTNLYQEQSATFAARAQEDSHVTPGQAGLDWTDVLLREYRGGQDGN